MKRYLLSIAFSIMAFGVVAVYYVFGSADHLPEYKLVTLEGDPHEGDTIELSGSYGGRKQTEALAVTADGSRYLNRNFSLRTQLLYEDRRFFKNAQFESLYEKHRNFMRGKRVYSQIYVDNEWYIYAKPVARTKEADDRELKYRISAIDRAADKEVEFEVSIPDFPPEFIYAIAGLQRNGNELHLFTLQYSTGYTEGYYDHVLDLNAGKWIRSEQLIPAVKQSGNHVINNSIILNESSSGYILLIERLDRIESGSIASGAYSSTRLSANQEIYSYITGERIKLPEAFARRDYADYTYYQSDSLRHEYYNLLKFSEDEAMLSRYNVATGEEQENFISVKPEQFGADKIGQAVIRNDKLYLLLQVKDEMPKTAVIDITSGKLLYLGQVQYEKPEVAKTEKLQYLRLQNIYITD